MVNFSIQTIISPLVKPTNDCFYKANSYVISKNPKSSAADIDHDLKALIFNAASIIIISATAMAYLKIIYLTTAAAVITIFYLFRRVIDETMKSSIPEKAERANFFDNILLFTQNKTQMPPVNLPAPIRSWASYFYYDENTLSIANIHIWKFTKYPLIEVLRMIIKA